MRFPAGHAAAAWESAHSRGWKYLCGLVGCIPYHWKSSRSHRLGCEGLKGFDFAHRIKGSVPVQARDHRKRHCNQLSADSNQRDYALAA